MAPTLLVERAPAKVNLTLHVTGRRPDGWHELHSLVAFTRAGDTLSLDPGADLGLAVDGPTAAAAGDNDDNLVARSVKPGFFWRDRTIRPEEIVARRWKAPEPAPAPPTASLPA